MNYYEEKTTLRDRMDQLGYSEETTLDEFASFDTILDYAVSNLYTSDDEDSEYF